MTVHILPSAPTRVNDIIVNLAPLNSADYAFRSAQTERWKLFL